MGKTYTSNVAEEILNSPRTETCALDDVFLCVPGFGDELALEMCGIDKEAAECTHGNTDT